MLNDFLDLSSDEVKTIEIEVEVEMLPWWAYTLKELRAILRSSTFVRWTKDGYIEKQQQVKQS